MIISVVPNIEKSSNLQMSRHIRKKQGHYELIHANENSKSRNSTFWGPSIWKSVHIAVKQKAPCLPSTEDERDAQ